MFALIGVALVHPAVQQAREAAQANSGEEQSIVKLSISPDEQYPLTLVHDH